MSELTSGVPSPDEYLNQAAEAARQIIDQSASAEALTPKPETSQFVHEISTPHFIDVGEVNYGVFRLNRHLEDQDINPVVINLAHGEEADRGAGRFDLNAFAQTLDRPLVVIDMPGMGKSKWHNARSIRNASFDTIASDQLAILDKLEIKDFDIVGMSMGGVMSAKIAALAGARAKHLVTFFAPSFEERPVKEMVGVASPQNQRDFHNAAEAAPEEVEDERIQAIEHKKANVGNGRLQTIGSILKYGHLLTKAQLGQISDELSPTTQWLDIAGTQDAFSDWKSHVQTVRTRNSLHPRTSATHLISGETHAWQAYYRWEVAGITAAYIAK